MTTQILDSYFRDLGPIPVLPYRGRQQYMHTFSPQNPVMAAGFEDYQEVVALLCRRAGIEAPEAHMTVDEKVVLPGRSQRRPGAHVDGCYVAEAPSRYRWHQQLTGDWLHYHYQVPRPRMAIIVASSAPGCIVYPGLFQVNPEPDGNCEHIRAELGPGLLLEAGRGYLLSPDCIHESRVFDEATPRTFLRIAFGGTG